VDELEDADRLNSLVEDLLADRAAQDWDAFTADDLELARVMALFKAGRSENLIPDSTFVQDLGARLRALEIPTPSTSTSQQPPTPTAVPQAPSVPSLRLPRRRVLGDLLVGASSLLVGGLGGRTLGQAQADDALYTAQQAPYNVPLVGHENGEWITVAHRGALRPGDVMRFEAGALIGYFSFDGSSYSAVSAVCSHMGCLLRWDNPVFVCPCHGSMYRRTGTVLDGVTRHPLPTITVRVLPSGAVQVYTTAIENTRGTGVENYPTEP